MPCTQFDVILSGGEAGARDLTTAGCFNDVDGNARDADIEVTLTAAPAPPALVRSLERLRRSQDDNVDGL